MTTSSPRHEPHAHDGAAGNEDAHEATELAAGAAEVDFSGDALVHAASRFRERVHVVRDGHRSAGEAGSVGVSFDEAGPWPLAEGHALLASLPPIYPEWLGGLGPASFCAVHEVRFPYCSGAMAQGIASRELVVAMARAELLSFFGSAGLPVPEVEAAIHLIARDVGPHASWGVDLIHAPHDPSLEDKLVDVYLGLGVRRVSASAFMRVTPAVVRYASTGLDVDAGGDVVRPNHLFAKISRAETAQHFMLPAPAAILASLVQQGLLTAREAELAARVPLAEDITVEADSGGHTDNRPLTALLPTLIQLRDEIAAQHAFLRPTRIGAAGGIGSPAAVAAAFALGAAYVMTGSINQSTVEAATSDTAKAMLAAAEPTDVAMAPSPDMFEIGSKVQVLKRGTLFASRATLLRELYKAHESLEAIPAETMARLEKELFLRPVADVWNDTKAFFAVHDAREIERGERDPKHKMALVFRSYIGLASKWAIRGVPERKMDFQIWCGPAMGAFNRWVRGTFLAEPRQRSVVQVALNLLEGAAVVTRAQQLRSAGLPVPDAAFRYVPRFLGADGEEDPTYDAADDVPAQGAQASPAP